MAMLTSRCQAPTGLHVPGGLSPSRLGTYVLITVLVLLDLLAGTEAQAEPPTRSGNCTREAEPCKKGLIVPMWQPQGNLSIGDKVARAIVYALSLIYMFLGVSIVADRFMAAIEVITSKEKDVVVKKPDGETAVVSVRIWNETVSNLTLMALGSSAPEILLAVIEIGHNNFTAGDLGPSTIVGSAAFNLFVIIAICVSTIPNGEIRRIKHLRVFVITATWSIFAYIWLYFIISVSSRGVIQVWEALLTFAFFPGTVLTAYIADRKFLIHHILEKRYRAKRKATMADVNDTELVDGKVNRNNEYGEKPIQPKHPSLHQFEQHRNEFIDILRGLRQKHPNADMRTLEEMAELEAVNRWPKSRAYYRIQATRKMIGAGKVIRKDKIERRGSLQDVVLAEEKDPLVTKVYFDPGHYTVMENVGVFPITVTREGGDPNTTLYVDFYTTDGTANAGTDYEAVEGTLIFQSGEAHKQFNITVIDDDIFEEDEHFYAHIKNPRLFTLDGNCIESPDQRRVELAEPFLATVMILDDDHPGIFHFEDKEISVTENIGEMLIKVARSSGARGSVAVPFHAVDGTAKAGVDFEIISGELYFENDEAEQFIKINIVDDEEYEKTESFFLELEEPYIIKSSVGRRVLVAGGAGLIGTAVVQELLARGAKVIVTTRSQGRFEELKKKIPADKQANLSSIVADVSTEEGTAAIFAQSTNQPGGVQHVIASVGSWWQGGKLVDQSLEVFNQNIKDRVTSHFLLFKAFCAYLEKQQGSTYTMLTGGAGDTYMAPGISLICISSGALHGFSTCVRAELKDSNLAFCEFRIHCMIQAKPDSEMPTSDPHSMGHDLIARGILATVAARTHDRKDVHNRSDAQAIAQ